jgi:predicted kinase
VTRLLVAVLNPGARCRLQTVIFIGIPGSGKTTFYRKRFLETHVRISLDMLRTRQCGKVLLSAYLASKQPFVIDNTDMLQDDRACYIKPARQHDFRVIGYYFQTPVQDCLRRNAGRIDKASVPPPGLLGKHKNLELPSRAEGFDESYSVQIAPEREFQVSEW